MSQTQNLKLKLLTMCQTLTAPSELVFSVAGLTISKDRARMPLQNMFLQVLTYPKIGKAGHTKPKTIRAMCQTLTAPKNTFFSGRYYNIKK